MTKVVVVAAEKGGAGKTSLLVNVARGLGESGNSVLIADMDGQSSATIHLLGRADFERNIYHLLTSPGVMVGDIAKEPDQSVWPNIAILPGDRALHELSVTVALRNYLEPNHLLKSALDATEGYFDYILIDTPPKLGIEARNALVAATHYFTVTDASEYGKNSIEILRLLGGGVKKTLNKNLVHAGIVLTKYSNSNSKSKKEFLAELKADKEFLSDHIISFSDYLQESQKENMPLKGFKPYAKITKEYQQLSKYIQGL